MRKFLSIVLVAATLFTMVSAGIMTSTASTDPADSYKPITAPYEDSDIQMWFQHSNVKVHQEDTKSTGRDTYSIYMAKNEIQGAQVVLYSPSVTKSNVTARVTDFTAMDGSGNTVEAKLYFEFYIQTESLNSTDVLGVNDPASSIIRPGIIPDGIADIELSNYNTKDPGRFTLTAGKTQTLLARLKTTSDTAPGWYSGTFNLFDADNNVIKTATIYAYVWDFEIPEELNYQTAFLVAKGTDTEATYKEWYDYLLENRILAMSVPGEINSSNEYLSNPRVSAFGVTSKSSPNVTDLSQAQIKEIYTDLSTMDNWDKVKEKAYFYTVDEPTSKEQSDALGGTRPTVETIISQYNKVAGAWENPYTTVAFHENHPYPYYAYDIHLAYKNGKYLTETDGSATFNGVKDAIQGMFDTDTVTQWCPKMNAFTPAEYLTNYVAINEATEKVRNLNGIVSGFNINNGWDGCYFNWDSIFGSFADRFKAYQTEKAAEGKNIKLWWYASGTNAHYTYCNHLIENTGLQTQLMFWQSMQVGSTGYLYYGANLWSTQEEGGGPVYGSSNKYDGSMGTIAQWRVNLRNRNGYKAYGNGVIFYGSDARSVLRLNQKYLGTIRVELMRDGIEDYEMLNLYRQYYGEDAMQKMISKVSANVVDYLSLPGFDRSGWDKSLTDEDIFALVRIEVGNAVEAAVGGKVPADKYTVTIDGEVYGTYDAGQTVTLPAPEAVEVSGVVSRFYKWEGAEAAGSSVTTTATAGGKAYTMTMPAANVDLTSSYVTVGDLNSDGKLTAVDLAIFKLAATSKVTLTAEQTEAMDIDGNGTVNAEDAVYIKQYLAAEYIPSK